MQINVLLYAAALFSSIGLLLANFRATVLIFANPKASAAQKRIRTLLTWLIPGYFLATRDLPAPPHSTEGAYLAGAWSEHGVSATWGA
ncbi:MAG: hypothetical protein EOP11_12620 [Proteobacteria bacterium]|nr:MAG: hypothetical protein EOP11_12620 [Pseudomonadota bacterium]